MTVTVHSNTTIFRVGNDRESTLTADVAPSDTSIAVTSGAQFDLDGGYACIISTDVVDDGKIEEIKYAGVSGNTLTGVTRAQGGSTAINADVGDAIEERVVAEYHNAIKDALITTSQDLFDLTQGDESFLELQISRTIGSTAYIAEWHHDGSGNLILDTALGGVGTKWFVQPSSGNVVMAIAEDESEVSFAATQMRLYAKEDYGVGGSLMMTFEPEVAASGVAYDFDTVNDITSGAVAKFSNLGSAVLTVAKTLTTGASLRTDDGVLHIPAFTSARATPANDDLWVEDVGGVRTLKVRISGSTYSVTLT